MNNGTYIGRLSKNFAASQSGKSGLGTIAVDRPYPFNKDKDGNKVTDFLTIKIIGEDKVKRAAQYLKKGVKIAVIGVTCRDTEKDDQGNWKEYNYIMVIDWEFAESKASSEAAPSSSDDTGFMNIPDDIDEELPFL